MSHPHKKKGKNPPYKSKKSAILHSQKLGFMGRMGMMSASIFMHQACTDMSDEDLVRAMMDQEILPPMPAPQDEMGSDIVRDMTFNMMDQLPPMPPPQEDMGDFMEFDFYQPPPMPPPQEDMGEIIDIDLAILPPMPPPQDDMGEMIDVDLAILPPMPPPQDDMGRFRESDLGAIPPMPPPMNPPMDPPIPEDYDEE